MKPTNTDDLLKLKTTFRGDLADNVSLDHYLKELLGFHVEEHEELFLKIARKAGAVNPQASFESLKYKLKMLRADGRNIDTPKSYVGSILWRIVNDEVRLEHGRRTHISLDQMMENEEKGYHGPVAPIPLEEYCQRQIKAWRSEFLRGLTREELILFLYLDEKMLAQDAALSLIHI